MLFFLIRGLPQDPYYGSTRHIIMATEGITLYRGMQLLRDVSQSEAGLITATLGSGTPTASADSATSVLSLNTDAPTIEQTARGKRMTKLCRIHGPCKHHGPRSLHATSECKDPTLSRRKKQKKKKGSDTAASPQPSTPGSATTMTMPVQAQQQLLAPTTRFQPPMLPHVHD